MEYFLRHLRLCAACCLAVAASALSQAKIDEDAFDESSSPEPEENVSWPEAEFPAAEQRGQAFQPGQRFDYRAQWGFFRKAGNIVISTASVADAESPQLQVKLETASAGLIRRLYPMNMEASTILDAVNWRVLSDAVSGKIRSSKSSTLALFDYEAKTVNYTDDIEPERSRVKPLPYDITLDYASSILQLRAWEMEVGAHYPLCVNSRGKFYFVEMQVQEIEEIKTEFGRKSCYRIEPVRVFPRSKTFREGGGMSIWITADEQRIPMRVDVRTSVGNARMLLEDYALPEPTDSLVQR